MFFFRVGPPSVCPANTEQNIFFLFISPPTEAKPTKTVNPCVLESLLSYLSFKILQLSIQLLWQRLLIIRSEIRLARALCPASISHARDTVLAWMLRGAGFSVSMLLVKIVNLLSLESFILHTNIVVRLSVYW